MLITTKGKGIELLNKSLPYPEQMTDIDLECCEKSIYFTWRGARYKFDLNYCSVDKSENGCLVGDDASILMTQLLKYKFGAII